MDQKRRLVNEKSFESSIPRCELRMMEALELATWDEWQQCPYRHTKQVTSIVSSRRRVKDTKANLDLNHLWMGLKACIHYL